MIRQGVAVAGVLPRVAGDEERAPQPPRGDHHGPGLEHLEAPPVPVVGEGAHHPLAVLEQRGDRHLHVHVHALVDAVVLEGAQHLESGAVAHVGQARVGVASEVALQDGALGRPVHEGAPFLQLLDPVRCLLGVELRHAPVVEVLPAPHGVGEVDAPVVPAVHVGQGRGDAALRHDRVRLPQQGLAHDAHRGARRRGGDGRPQAGPSRTDDEHVVLVRAVLGHQKSLQSCHTPMDSIRM